MIEFKAWAKTPRLFREVVITEKIDGTNAAIIIEERNPTTQLASGVEVAVVPDFNGKMYVVGAQSRKRLITPESDNFGFARWVYDNADELVKLGPGHHYGEWWGSGIQRGYGLRKGERFFSLFNVDRWEDAYWNGGDDWPEVENLGTVPVLHRGVFDQDIISATIDDLRARGSQAQPDYMNPEGICIFHTQSRQVYKVLLENDDISKTEAGVA